MSATTQNIALAFEAFDKLTLDAVVAAFPDKISTIMVNNPEALSDSEINDRLRALRSIGLEVLFDVQIAGGFEAMKNRLEYYDRVHRPEIVTTAMGISIEGLRVITGYLKEQNSNMRVLVTGVLPELSVDALASASNGLTMDPREYTTVRASVAKRGKASGVYGSAHDASDLNWTDLGLEYVATGISPDGKAYSNKRPENVTKLSTAFAIGATTGLIGSSIYEPRFGVNKPEQVDGRVELIGAMINGSVIETHCAVE